MDHGPFVLHLEMEIAERPLRVELSLVDEKGGQSYELFCQDLNPSQVEQRGLRRAALEVAANALRKAFETSERLDRI